MKKKFKNSTDVFLEVLRETIPSLIANDIIGMSSMNEIDKGTFDLTVKLTKEHYKYFLRVYNRRQYHKVSYIDSLGYPSVKLLRRPDDSYDGLNARIWAIKNLSRGSYINSGSRFWFAREKDYTLFLMRWT